MSTTPSQHEPDLRTRIAALVEAGDLSALEPLLAELHPSDVADVLESLSATDQIALIEVLPAELASDALVEMEDGDRAAELLATFAPGKQAELVHEMEVDDATDLIGDLEPAEQDRVLAELSTKEAGEIRGLLEFGEETAGGLMTTALVVVAADLNAAQALEQVRVQGREVEDFYLVFVVDAHGQLLGTVPLDVLVIADPGDAVASLVKPTQASVTADEDQEEVGKLISRYNLPAVAVVDAEGRLLGRITFDDVIDVIEAEQTEDLLRFSGVSDEEEIRGDWIDAVKGRLPWLLLHTLTLSLAAAVVLIFQDVLQRFTILVFTMPIIAGLGGNAGTQALAVTVRRLATASGPLEPKGTAVGKEILVALANGFLVATAVAAVVMFVNASGLSRVGTEVPSLRLGSVVLAAMWGNVLLAGSAGAFIPTLLNRLGLDPAVASSVFLASLTDLAGFLLLLGLASAILL